jgi:cellulose synthase/poly-beta-1,6-N-acetylglucosamine synthase-like glycosyltransferase
MSAVVVLLLVLFGAVTLLLSVLSAYSLRWMLGTWNSAAALRRRRAPDVVEEPAHGFSLIVPARHEVAVLGATLERLLLQQHPRFEVVVVVGHDDPDTEDVAREYAAIDPDRVKVVIDRHLHKNKPRALNTGLGACSHEIVGVFDAEDEVATGLLRVVDHHFQDPGVHVVQGGVQLMNFHSRWFSVRNVLEYFFHFASRLHLHAERGLIPLGGNTVFFRRELLEAAGGWDEECLAEDCEIGMRLSAAGARTVVVYDAALATREEAPTDVAAFMRQRTRWDHGFLQVRRKGEWKQLPTRRQRWSAWFVLANPALQGIGTVAALGQIVLAFAVHVPLGLTMLAFVPLLLTAVIVAVELAGLSEFSRAFDQKARVRDYAWVVVGYLPYHLMLAAASFEATRRARRGDLSWAKTHHEGLHREPVLVGAFRGRTGDTVIDLRDSEPAGARIDLVALDHAAEEVEGVA